MGKADRFPLDRKGGLKGFGHRGVLPSQHIRDLVSKGRIRAKEVVNEDQIQPASIDLRLGPLGYRVQASFLPGSASKVRTRLDALLMSELDLTKSAVLERGCVYIIPLMEEVELPNGIAGLGNPRSTTGRLDVFTRLITDYGKEFDRVTAGYEGSLYAEVVPRTFTVLVREGMRLSQLRLVHGDPQSADEELKGVEEEGGLVYLDGDQPAKAEISRGLLLSVNLESQEQRGVIGYKAKQNAPILDMGKIDYYDPREFWDLVCSPKKGSIILNPGDFYLLGSKEKVRIPPRFAAEMVAFDPSLGEFRIHYAGFFDPGFGHSLSDLKGTAAVLEVRAHEVPFLIEDGQTVARLVFSQLLETPDKLYGPDIGSWYQRQTLALSRHFRRAEVPC